MPHLKPEIELSLRCIHRLPPANDWQMLLWCLSPASMLDSFWSHHLQRQVNLYPHCQLRTPSPSIRARCPCSRPRPFAAALSSLYRPVKVVPARPGRSRSTALVTPVTSDGHYESAGRQTGRHAKGRTIISQYNEHDLHQAVRRGARQKVPG